MMGRAATIKSVKICVGVYSTSTHDDLKSLQVKRYLLEVPSKKSVTTSSIDDVKHGFRCTVHIKLPKLSKTIISQSI